MALTCLVFPAAHSQTAGLRSITVDPDGTSHISGVALPPSSLLSAESRAVLARQAAERTQAQRGVESPVELRRRLNDAAEPTVRRVASMYPVDISDSAIDGIDVTIVTPKGGAPARNRARVLINIPGGGFARATRAEGILESAPMAAVGGFEVVSVRYRQAPEFRFPAASEDVATVYRALLKRHQPAAIGLFGCSAGGALVAQSEALFQRLGLPSPGVLGICAAGAGIRYAEGDSGTFFALGTAAKSEPVAPDATDGFVYFAGRSRDDPAVSPVRDRSVLAKFPPTIFLSSTRDFAMSTAAFSHRRLLQAGVESQLLVFDGLSHAFVVNPDFPESREAVALMASFYDRHLSR